MSKTSDVIYVAILFLFAIKSSIARPFTQEEFRNAILKNTESRWIEEIFDNDTDFEETNQVSDHFPSNRDLVKSLIEDYEEYEYYYTYEEDPIIEIRFRRNVEEATSRSENDIFRSTTVSSSGSASSSPLSNAFPKPTSMRNRRNRRMKKNLRKNRRLRKTLKRDKKFLSNRT